jgi:carboxylesterase type B
LSSYVARLRSFSTSSSFLGFLRTGIEPDPGGAKANFGLWDQIAALEWIQDNVRQFGGDPGNVTLLGHGTGAACINLLMTSAVSHKIQGESELELQKNKKKTYKNKRKNKRKERSTTQVI